MFGKPWNAIKKGSTPAGSAASGSSALPTASGSGDFIVATDAPVTFLDDPTSKAWIQILDGKSLPIPAPVANWTLAGNITMGQIGQHLLAAVSDGNINMATQPIGAVAAPYAVEVSAYQVNEGNLIGFPLFGACLASGNVVGAKAESMIRYDGSFGHASETDTIGSATRSTHSTGDNTPLNGGGEMQHMRIINDGTNLYYQLSADGYLWGNWGSPVAVAGLTTPFTHWGFVLCHLSGPTVREARVRIVRARLRQLTRPAVTAGSWAGNVGTFTCAAHGLTSGVNVQMAGFAAGGGTAPNGYQGPVTVVDPNTFSLPNLVTFSSLSAGTVLNLTQ